MRDNLENILTSKFPTLRLLLLKGTNFSYYIFNGFKILSIFNQISS